MKTLAQQMREMSRGSADYGDFYRSILKDIRAAATAGDYQKIVKIPSGNLRARSGVMEALREEGFVVHALNTDEVLISW